ncbi:ABC transporter substrate-binding protein [Bordetella sp. BOR01]|uniref:ABC transporter substrate-binding protein n=1 Tax=Bordetella sp. BOR01 TaxID=2854779 RepID=UPI0021048B2C|nr:ABC transporter substrate-binding protein [Bordetella sp. BOR01]
MDRIESMAVRLVRRTGARGRLWACTALMCASMASWAQDSGPVKIGMVFPKQGPSASIGEFLSRGAMLAVEQHGKVLGRDVDVVFLDEPNAQLAQQNFQKLVDEHRVAGVVGANSSASALAMMGVAARSKTPLVVAGAAAREVTGANCNPYTFRFQATVPVQMAGLMPIVDKQGKKVYFITPAYAFGQDILRTGRTMLKSNGGQEAGVDEVPLNTADYSSYVLKIRAARPDAVVGGLVGQDLSNFLKAWNAMGMKDKIPYYEIAVSDTDFWDVGAASSAGTYVKPWYYNDPANSEAEKAFTKLFIEKYGRPPADKAYSGWLSMRSLLDAIDAAKSTEGPAVAAALEQWKDDKGAFPAYYRTWDHQLIRPSVIASIKKDITDKWDFFDVVGHTSQAEEDTLRDFGTKEEVGCNMPAR